MDVSRELNSDLYLQQDQNQQPRFMMVQLMIFQLYDGANPSASDMWYNTFLW